MAGVKVFWLDLVLLVILLLASMVDHRTGCFGFVSLGADV